MPGSKVLDALKGRTPLPDSEGPIPDGKYFVDCAKETELWSDSADIQSQIWFASPRLDADTIKRIDAVQLLTESHDQGPPEDLSAGNWTWFELAILSDDGVRTAAHTSIPLTWRSHSNRFGTTDFGWKAGAPLGEKHDIMSLLQDGDAVAVRLCSRFPGWGVVARKGYLLFDVNTDELERPPPPAYDEVVHKVKSMQGVFRQVNAQLQPAFMPTLPEALFGSAQAMGLSSAAPLRVLSFDGGGVRGIASLMMLRAVMDRYAPGKKPCEVFDLIGGTSTGGYIAIMLGRLCMTIDDCLETYVRFMTRIFDKGMVGKGWSMLTSGTFYPADKLEAVIKELVKKKLDNEDALLMDPADPNPRCRVFCMAVHEQALNNRAPVFLRSYTNPMEMSVLPGIRIWEAARATSAAPAYFKPMVVGGLTLVDGGLGANNPLGWLWTEVLGVFGAARRTDCFLSIGTGIPPNVEVSLSPLNLWAVAAATNTEIVNVLFRSLVDAFAPRPMARKYFRLNVSEALPPTAPDRLPSYVSIGALDDTGALDALKLRTREYLERKDVVTLLDNCAQAMAGTLDPVAAQ